MITKMHQRALLLFALPLFHLLVFSQTVSSLYQPGVTTEGAVYFLPKTAIAVTVTVEKTTYTPGDFCQYSERYLRIKGVSPTPSVSYRITAIRQQAVAVADTSKRYAVKFDAKTVAANIRLSVDGILQAINTEERMMDDGRLKENAQGSTISPTTPKINPGRRPVAPHAQPTRLAGSRPHLPLHRDL